MSSFRSRHLLAELLVPSITFLDSGNDELALFDQVIALIHQAVPNQFLVLLTSTILIKQTLRLIIQQVCVT